MNDKEEPYIERERVYDITKGREYNSSYGDDRYCKCGHQYHRHFDGYHYNDPVGCKYCECYTFEERPKLTEKELYKKSKLLSFALRHEPEKLNLNMDDKGWVYVNQLCRSGDLVPPEIKEIVEKNNKKRFELNEDETKIRARQGHSIDVDVELEEKEPPSFLYHGTSDRFLKSIKKNGLKKINRKYVHLSEDRETAEKVGKRHGGNLVILRIRADEYQFEEEAKFYLSRNGVWLTDEVPVEYISFPFKIEFGNTERGFSLGEFKDRYGVSCSIQQSSLATENAIWLGVDDPDPKIMGSKVGKGRGWVKFDIPEDVLLKTRMHLTEEMAVELIDKLQKWVKTGELK